MTTPHIMLDIETLGTTPGCVIASIGACTFDPESGEVARQTFYDLIDIGDAVGAGLTIEYGTVLWWLRQSDEARAEITRQDARSPLKEALDNLSAWYLEIGADEHTQVWCNGASFDFTILEAAYRAVNAVSPWSYWQLRCARTARNLLPACETPRQGVAHNALADAIYQAQCLCAAMRGTADLSRQLEVSRHILRDMNEAWVYFSEYDVPIYMKERIEAVLGIEGDPA